jgi:hypothetical protein
MIVSYIDRTSGCCDLDRTRRWWRNCGIEHDKHNSDSFSEVFFQRSNMSCLDSRPKGGHIMLGGIAAQLGNHSSAQESRFTRLIWSTAVIVTYVVLKTEFFLRYVKDRPITSSVQSTDTLQTERPEMSLRLKIMASALEFSTICLVIRYVRETALQCVGFSF